MELQYTIKNSEMTINQILKNKLNISSRLFLKLLNNNSIFIMEIYVILDYIQMLVMSFQ